MSVQANIDKRYYRSLGRIFTSRVIDDLIRRGKSEYFSEVVYGSGVLSVVDSSWKFRDFFDWLYNFLFDHYRNEYMYKNALAVQFGREVHTVESHMLCELRVGRCKADVVILNGTSTVYEIKSDLDSFVRLERQLSAYLDFFDHINVITSRNEVSQVQERVPPCVGLMVLTPQRKLEVVREPESNKEYTDPSTIFASFRKHEYLEVIKERFGSIPVVPNTQIYEICRDLFCTLSPNEAHSAMLSVIARRADGISLQEVMSDVPISLQSYAAGHCVDSGMFSKLRSLLSRKLYTVLQPAV